MKKYFKKSLSLMMAALMLLSCWVFFAPEAEAVNAEQYWYKCYIHADNGADGAGADFKLQGRKNNGQGTLGTIYTSSGVPKKNGSDYYVSYGYTDYFPTNFEWHYWNKARVGRKFSGFILLYVGKDEESAMKNRIYFDISATRNSSYGNCSASDQTMTFSNGFNSLGQLSIIRS